jgi:hypothetical protein
MSEKDYLGFTIWKQVELLWILKYVTANPVSEA